jgi:hypothetical protein
MPELFLRETLFAAFELLSDEVKLSEIGEYLFILLIIE